MNSTKKQITVFQLNLLSSTGGFLVESRLLTNGNISAAWSITRLFTTKHESSMVN